MRMGLRRVAGEVGHPEGFSAGLAESNVAMWALGCISLLLALICAIHWSSNLLIPKSCAWWSRNRSSAMPAWKKRVTREARYIGFWGVASVAFVSILVFVDALNSLDLTYEAGFLALSAAVLSMIWLVVDHKFPLAVAAITAAASAYLWMVSDLQVPADTDRIAESNLTALDPAFPALVVAFYVLGGVATVGVYLFMRSRSDRAPSGNVPSGTSEKKE